MSWRCTCPMFEAFGQREPVVRHSLTCSREKWFAAFAAGRPVGRFPASTLAEAGGVSIADRAVAAYMARDVVGPRAYLDLMAQDREVVREKIHDGLPMRPPKPAPIHHPTLQDIAARDQEIMEWHLKEDRRVARARLAVPAGIMGVVITVASILLLPPEPLFVVVVFLLWIASACAVAWGLSNWGRGVNRMKQLRVVPFTAAENTYLIHTQDEEPFRAVCACPGCGSVNAHLISESKDMPAWAKTIRHCGTCEREWANN